MSNRHCSVLTEFNGMGYIKKEVDAYFDASTSFGQSLQQLVFALL